jgi:hypothetical protein
MNGRFTASRAPDAQAPSLEIDIAPPERNDLTGAQTVAVRQQDGGGIPVAVPALSGGLH